VGTYREASGIMDKSAIRLLIESGKINTPSYIYDESVLDTHVNRMLKIAGEDIDYCYAMKANPFLVPYMADKIGKIEVCSPGELEICRHYGIPGEKIVFSGVNKTAKDIETAILYGVDIITLESVKHFKLVRDCCLKMDKTVRVMPRLSSGAQFGMSKEELTEIVADRDKYPYLDIVGIHYFTGTQKKKIGKDIEEIELIDGLIKSLKTEYGFECRIFEYGPGLGVPYFEGEDFDSPYEGLEELTSYIRNKKPEYKVVFELGRFFVYSCMDYITTVDDIKRAADTNICIVDGGIHHLNYYGQNMAMRVPLIDKLSLGDNDAVSDCYGIDANDTNWKICGSLCTFADVLVRKVGIGTLNIGDVLIFHNAGAYSITESPALFLSRTMPEIIKVCGDEMVDVIRPHVESYEVNHD